MKSRIEFSKNLGLQIVSFHLLLVLMIGAMGLFFDPTVYELLRISLPITAAYFTTILAWMAVADELEDSRKIGWQSRAVFQLTIYAMFMMLFLAPIYIQQNRGANIEAVKTFYSVVELAFGGAMGVIARDFFGQKPEGKETKQEEKKAAK